MPKPAAQVPVVPPDVKPDAPATPPSSNVDKIRGLIDDQMRGKDPARLGSTTAHWQLTISGTGGGSYNVAIKDGKVTVAEGWAPRPTAVISMPQSVFDKATGEGLSMWDATSVLKDLTVQEDGNAMAVLDALGVEINVAARKLLERNCWPTGPGWGACERRGRQVRYIKDAGGRFLAWFDPTTGEYVRTGILDDCGKDTGKEAFMASFPHLVDVGIMGHCLHGQLGICLAAGVQCYQDGLNAVQPNMPLDDFRRLARECEGRVFQFALGGRGDPDQHEDIEGILAACAEHRIVPNYTTSGLGLDDRAVDLCAEYCGAVAVSWYRRDHTLRAIERLLDRGVKTNIHYVLGQTVSTRRSTCWPTGASRAASMPWSFSCISRLASARAAMSSMHPTSGSAGSSCCLPRHGVVSGSGLTAVACPA